MEIVALQVDGRQLVVRHFDSGWIAATIQLSLDSQAGLGAGAGNQVDDHLVADEWLAAPVLGDVAEHAVLNLVPLAGARRKVTDMDRQPQLGRQVLQCQLPKAAAAAVAAAPIGGDQQFLRAAIAGSAHLAPPPTDGLYSKARGVVVDADRRSVTIT